LIAPPIASEPYGTDAGPRATSIDSTAKRLIVLRY